MITPRKLLHNLLAQIGYEKEKISEYVERFENTVLLETLAKEKVYKNFVEKVKDKEFEQILKFVQDNLEDHIAIKFTQDFYETYGQALAELIDNVFSSSPPEEKETIIAMFEELRPELQEDGYDTSFIDELKQES